MMSAVTVLGAGSWGTALAIVLADNGHDVRLWTHRKEQAELINSTHKNEKYLEIMIPEKIRVYHNLEESIQGAETIVIVVPTKAMRDVCRQLNSVLRHSVTIVHASKGIEPESLKRVSEMISDEMKNYAYEDVVVLSGPSHAEEEIGRASCREREQRWVGAVAVE